MFEQVLCCVQMVHLHGRPLLSKHLTVKHVKHVKSQWTKRANGQLEADSDDLWHPAARLAVVVDEEIHLATKQEPVQRIGEPTAVE